MFLQGWTSHFTDGSGATGLTSSAATVCLPCIAGKFDDDDVPSNECIDCGKGATTQNDAHQIVSSAATQCKFQHEYTVNVRPVLLRSHGMDYHSRVFVLQML